MARIVILGAGTAGTIMANRLSRSFSRKLKSKDTTITVVDNDPAHVYQPGLLFIPFGEYTPAQLQRPRRQAVNKHVNYVNAAIDRVASNENRVYIEGRNPVDYDL